MWKNVKTVSHMQQQRRDANPLSRNEINNLVVQCGLLWTGLNFETLKYMWGFFNQFNFVAHLKNKLVSLVTYVMTANTITNSVFFLLTLKYVGESMIVYGGDKRN